MKTIFIAFLSLSFSVIALGQQNNRVTNKAGAKKQQDTINFYPQIKDFNLTKVFAADSFVTQFPNLKWHKEKRDEPLGCIDTNYTRFYIHIISATKNEDNPYEYKVIGKTKVKNNICDFKGTITFTEAKIYASQEYPKLKEGFAIGDIVFYEDTNQAGSGIIKGKITSNFYIDKKGQLNYNSLIWGADAFSNNGVVGTWTSYKTKKQKNCNWGDYRIPECRNLDMGAGIFSPSDKYLKNGWENYREALFGNEIESKKAWQIENYEWWK
ncbi:MAG TPA: hypothetical protein VN922_06595 [Bacteroidia bacterium]|nr:hypothetical protein [Bacteroidia bacterium]